MWQKTQTAKQIKAAYRELALKYHPDRIKEDDAAAADKMKQINEAYAVLSDSQKRNDYDAARRQFGESGAYSQFRKNYTYQDIFSGADIESVFDELGQIFRVQKFFRSFTAVRWGPQLFILAGRTCLLKASFLAVH